MKHVLIAVGAMLVASQAVLSFLSPGITHDSISDVADILPLILLLSVPAACALLAAPALGRLKESRAALVAMVAFGLFMRLVWFGAPAPIEDDFYRYLWDGGVVAAGLDPYRVSPEDALAGKGLTEEMGTLAKTASPVLRRVNFANLTSIYPGVGQLAFAAAHFLAPWKLDGLRFVFLMAELATLILVLRILVLTGRSKLYAALYWCNPLVVFTAIATAHMDALVPPLVLGTLLAAHWGRLVPSAALLASAVGVKLWPVLLAPLLLRGERPRWRKLLVPAIVFLAVVSAAVLPLLLGGLSNHSGLAAYAQSWHNNNAPYAWLSYGLEVMFGDEAAVRRVLRIALFAASIGVACMIAARKAPALDDQLARALSIAAVVFYLSPSQFPWYALWFLPLAAVCVSWPLMLASVTLPAYYFFFPFAHNGEHDVFQYWIAFVHAAPVWTWLALRQFGQVASPRLAKA